MNGNSTFNPIGFEYGGLDILRGSTLTTWVYKKYRHISYTNSYIHLNPNYTLHTLDIITLEFFSTLRTFPIARSNPLVYAILMKIMATLARFQCLRIYFTHTDWTINFCFSIFI